MRHTLRGWGQHCMVSICFYDLCLSTGVAKDWSQKLINPFASETTESACIYICIMIIDISKSIQQLEQLARIDLLVGWIFLLSHRILVILVCFLLLWKRCQPPRCNTVWLYIFSSMNFCWFNLFAVAWVDYFLDLVYFNNHSHQMSNLSELKFFYVPNI